MFESLSKVIRIVVVPAAVVAAMLALSGPTRAEPIIALTTDNRLFTFDSATPAAASAPVAVTGLSLGSLLIGIDLRPSTGVLYGLTQMGGLYTLSPTTGAATFVAAIGGGNSLGSGFGFGIDFDPTAAAGSPLHVANTFSNGVFVDPPFAGVVFFNATLFGPAPALTGLAYTNNDRDEATGTTLYGIYGGDLYRMPNPFLSGATVLVGSLGVAATRNDLVGFDVSGLSGEAFASLTVSGVGSSGFYSIDLASGAASLVGTIAPDIGVVFDITAATVAPVVGVIPEPETYALMLLGLASLALADRRRCGSSRLGRRSTGMPA